MCFIYAVSHLAHSLRLISKQELRVPNIRALTGRSRLRLPSRIGMELALLAGGWGWTLKKTAKWPLLIFSRLALVFSLSFYRYSTTAADLAESSLNLGSADS